MTTAAYSERPSQGGAGESRTRYVPGTIIASKYRLDYPIATGGMGTVWLAWHTALEIRVAVKLTRPELRGEETTQRLLTEARVEASLQHPSVVRVFDYGWTERGDGFIVMEFLEGEDLAGILDQRKSLSPIIALQVLLPIVDALCCAHRNGVIHRDLKPDNIFLTYDDGRIYPKLIDFGIARREGRAGDESEVRITTSGRVLGSPTYMAPEQASGELDVDARVDVWSLCVVIYEAVTGRPPFSGKSCRDVMEAVISREPEPLTDQGSGETELWPILRRGMAKERASRFASMHELGQALAAWLARQGVHEDITGMSLAPRWGFASGFELFATALPPDPCSTPSVAESSVSQAITASPRSVPSRESAQRESGPRESPGEDTVPSLPRPWEPRRRFAGGGLMLAVAACLWLTLDAKAGRAHERPASPLERIEALAAQRPDPEAVELPGLRRFARPVTRARHAMRSAAPLWLLKNPFQGRDTQPAAR